MTLEFIFRLFLAGVLGALIGLDREYRAKEAGYRTHFLVSLGSALFMILSQYAYDALLGEPGVSLDPSRIAAQVVSGIGFIGAGTIIIHRQLVRGLTTAASLWASAGIGLASGAGMYLVAGAATVLTLIGLEGLNLVFRRLGQRRIMLVFSAADRNVLNEAFNRLRSEDYTVLSYEVTAERSGEGMLYRATLVIRAKSSAGEDRYLAVLQNDPDITVERIV